jgi:hypothetical protein
MHESVSAINQAITVNRIPKMNIATPEFIERKSSILSPEAVRDQFAEDEKDRVYFSKETILEHASDCTESGQFILDVMTAYFELLEGKGNTVVNEFEFYSTVRGLCQQLRNDTTDYVVRNA